MEPVAAHVVLLVPLRGHGVPVGDRRHGLVEGGVEDRHLRQLGQLGAGGLDAGQVGRLVQRREVDQAAQGPSTSSSTTTDAEKREPPCTTRWPTPRHRRALLLG